MDRTPAFPVTCSIQAPAAGCGALVGPFSPGSREAERSAGCAGRSGMATDPSREIQARKKQKSQ